MKQLTKNQQELIAKITEEFMAMNDRPQPTSFADILLDEINQTKRDFEAIEIKNQAIFAELLKQFNADIEYLVSECDKLNIDVEHNAFERGTDTGGFCGISVFFGKNTGYDERFSIGVKVPTLLHTKNALRKYELTPTLKYYISYDNELPFMDLMKNEVFKHKITKLYHRLNK